MLAILLALILLGSAQGTPPLAQGGVITGRILELDGTPAANKRIAAQAVLERSDVDLGASMMAGISETDGKGEFRLENIPPGRYYVVLDPLDLPSYYPGVTKPERATIVSVAEGSRIDHLDFKIPDFDGGKVFGRLLAPAKPLSSPVRVVLSRADSLSLSAVNLITTTAVTSVSTINGRVSITTSAGSVISLSLPAGTGTLSLSSASVTGISTVYPEADGSFELPKVRSGSYRVSTTPDIGFVPVTVDVDVVDVHGVELAPAGTTPETTTGVFVRGHVTRDPVPELLEQLRVGFISTTGSSGAPNVSVNPDGSFQIPNVKPGSYTLVTSPPSSTSTHTTFDVDGMDVNDLEVVPPYTVDVPGHIELEGGGTFKTSPAAITVESGHANVKPFRTSVSSDGKFKMNLLAGDNWLVVRNLPQEYSLASITYESRDLIGNSFLPDLGDTDGIRIVLASAAPAALHKVRGKVIGLPAVAIGSDTKVTLNGGGPGRHYITTALNRDGSFEFSGVLPDSYTAHVIGAPFQSELKFDVNNADVDGLQMKGELQIPVAGRVTIVDRSGVALPDFPFHYMMLDFLPNVTTGKVLVTRDGSFATALSGGDYTLKWNNLPAGYSVKSAAAGSVNLLRDKLKIDGSVIPSLEIALEYNPKTP